MFIIVNPTTGLFVADTGLFALEWTADLDAASRRSLIDAETFVARDTCVSYRGAPGVRPSREILDAAELQIVEVPA